MHEDSIHKITSSASSILHELNWHSTKSYLSVFSLHMICESWIGHVLFSTNLTRKLLSLLLFYSTYFHMALVSKGSRELRSTPLVWAR